MQKVILTTAAALMLAVVFTGSVSADYRRDRHHRGDDGNQVSVENEDTQVTTNTSAVADTGGNVQLGGGGGMALMFKSHHFGGNRDSQRMNTGNAVSLAGSTVDVNSTYLPDCGCFVRRGSSKTEVENENTRVSTTTRATAETGENRQVAGSPRVRRVRMPHSGGANQVMHTGAANAQAYSDIWVNMTDMSTSVN